MTAATILAEVGDFSISETRQTSCILWNNPSVKQSGKFEGTQNKMSKKAHVFKESYT